MTAQTFISAADIIRKAHPDMVRIFTEGGCYEFYRLLHAINPECRAVYDGVDGHVYGRLGTTLFDINGAHVDHNRLPLLEEDARQFCEAPTWSTSMHNKKAANQ